MRTTFLASPNTIRASLIEALSSSRRLDAAVAFVGRDWSDILGTFSGKTRLVCWLSSTATNPYAVGQMLQRGLEVRQLDQMHAKVYLCRGSSDVAIVGSANLSSAALTSDEAAGQYEAATKCADPQIVQEIERWFHSLWEKSRRISNADLAKAKLNWEERRRPSSQTRVPRSRTIPKSAELPPSWRPSKKLASLMAQSRLKVEKGDLSLATRLQERGDRAVLDDLVRSLANWTGHIGAYYPVYEVSPAQVRKAFRTLYDRGQPLSTRLAALAPNGALKLPGIGLTALTMLLSWAYPREYPPYNRRTVRFLEDFSLAGYVPATLSPGQYVQWVQFAQDLSARLDLPSPGHLDRLVWRYTEKLTL